MRSRLVLCCIPGRDRAVTAPRSDSVVTDPAVTARNTVTAVLKKYLVELQQATASPAAPHGATLSAVHDLGKVLPCADPPRWRTHVGRLPVRTVTTTPR